MIDNTTLYGCFFGITCVNCPPPHMFKNKHTMSPQWAKLFNYTYIWLCNNIKKLQYLVIQHASAYDFPTQKILGHIRLRPALHTNTNLFLLQGRRWDQLSVRTIQVRSLPTISSDLYIEVAVSGLAMVEKGTNKSTEAQQLINVSKLWVYDLCVRVCVLYVCSCALGCDLFTFPLSVLI